MIKWYDIQAKKSEKNATILIYDRIGKDFWDEGVSAKEFFKELEALDVSEINLRINSPGGNVFEGNSIYNVLKAHPAIITAQIDGVAASIASVIAMAADKIVMPENAMLMIHDPSAVVVGTADDMVQMADTLEKLKLGLVSSYLTHSNLDDSEISDMMSAETWITAEKAVKWGFADEMTEAVNVQSSFNFKGFKNTPQWLINGSSEQKPDRTTNINRRLKLKMRNH